MRYSLAVLAVLALIAGGCSGDDTAATQAPTTTTTTTTVPATTTTAPLQPHEVADKLFRAELDGDVAAWFAVYADDATFINATDYSWPLSEYYEAVDWVTDDFNGDGVLSPADWDGFTMALASKTGVTVTWECVSVSGDEAECSSTSQDALTEMGGGAAVVEEYWYRVEGDRIVESHWLTNPKEHAESTEVTETMLGKYDRWMHQNHREQWDQLFHEPWGDLLFVTLPETIPVHEQLMAEFLASR